MDIFPGIGRSSDGELRYPVRRVAVPPMRKTRFIVLAVVIWAVVRPAFAGEILFSTESPLSGYWDEEVIIRVDVKNTLGEDIFGSFTPPGLCATRAIRGTRRVLPTDACCSATRSIRSLGYIPAGGMTTWWM